MDPTGDVSSEQSSGCLTGFANCVHLMGHTGWVPLRGASNQNFCLFRVMYPHGVCSFRHPTGQSHLLSMAACSRIYFAISSKKDGYPVWLMWLCAQPLGFSCPYNWEFFIVWFVNIGVWDLNYRQRLWRAQPFGIEKIILNTFALYCIVSSGH